MYCILYGSSTLAIVIECWNSHSWKTGTFIFHIVNIIVADDLAMPGARVSATMVLTKFSQNDLSSAPKVLTINKLRPRQMDAISQTTFSNAFSWMKMFEFRLKFHWSLFPRVQLTIFQQWFRWWLGAVQATSHYLNQWWLVYWCIYASLGLNELMAVMFLLKQQQQLSKGEYWCPLCRQLANTTLPIIPDEGPALNRPVAESDAALVRDIATLMLNRPIMQVNITSWALPPPPPPPPHLRNEITE